MADEIKPQPGPQEAFLSSNADIVIYGGAAGGGKTYGLLMEPLRHIGNSGFGAVIFRKESTQITNEGGLWDTALSLYPDIGATPVKSPRLAFKWPGGGRVTFAHLNNDAGVLDYQGAQIPLICFDELTHFSAYQFFYMLSRNRTTCGVRPYVRATTNPDADSWVSGFIAWWIDQDTGLPVVARAGIVRWFVRISGDIVWGDSPGDLPGDNANAKSVTFIPASLTDNKALMTADPGYMANLEAMPYVEKQRLKYGNWKVRPAAGLYFPPADIAVVDVCPADASNWVRGWDLAATPPTEENPSPDATAGVKMARLADGRIVITNGVHARKAANDVRRLIKKTADADGRPCRIRIPQDPGQAGKEQAQSYTAMLSGYNVKSKRPTGSKVTRAEPFAAQWQAGNILLVKGDWNKKFLDELEAFPDGPHDDYVDAAADAFEEVIINNTFAGAVPNKRKYG